VDELSDRRLFRNTPTRSDRAGRMAPAAGNGSNRPDLT
jgi:hypothetical protein